MAARPAVRLRRASITLALLMGLLLPVAPAATAAPTAPDEGPGPLAVDEQGEAVQACLEGVRTAAAGVDDAAAGEACAQVVGDGSDTPAWVLALRQLRQTGELEDGDAAAGAATAEAGDAPGVDRPRAEAAEQRRVRERTARQRGEEVVVEDAVRPTLPDGSVRERALRGEATAAERQAIGLEEDPREAARAAALGGDADVLGAPVALEAVGGSIEGTLTAEGTGTPIADMCVDVYTPDFIEYRSTMTDVDGNYLHDGLPDATWYLYSWDCNSLGFIGEYWDNVTYESDATLIVTVGGAITGIDQVLAQAGSISGTVVRDDGGAPLADVCVDAWSMNGGGWAVTDGFGDYTIEGLVPGSYEVYFYDCGTNGYIPEYWEDTRFYDQLTLVPVASGQSVTGLDASLAPGGSISGNVTDATGAPLSDACVYAFTDDYSSYNSTVTDVNGDYVIGGLAADGHVVEFGDCDGVEPHHLYEYYDNTRDYDLATRVPVTAGATTPSIDAQLDIPGAISGTVVEDGSGTPLADICVDAYSTDNSWWGYGWGYTDLAGEYVIADLEPGAYNLVFYDCGTGVGYVSEWYDDTDQATATDVVVVGGQTTSGIDAGLSTGGSITGTVVADGSGAPLQGICVDAWTLEYDSWGGGFTDASGAYEIVGLSPGPHYVEFYDCSGQGWANEFYNDAAFDDATTVLVQGNGVVSGIDASLGTGVSLSGRVTAEDTGLGLGEVCVDAAPVRGSGYGFGFTSEDGSYVINGLGRGNYVVQFFDCGTGRYIEEFWDDKPTWDTADRIAVGATNVTGINAVLTPGGTISGTVTDADTAAPLEGICAYAESDLWGGVAFTQADGTYSIRGLRSGSYRVEYYDCSDNGYIGEWYDDAPDPSSAAQIAVTAPDEVTGIDAGLLKGGTIAGTVTAERTGTPAADVCVEAYGDDGWGFGYTDADGTYAVRGLRTGEYTVWFYDCNNGVYVGEYYNDVQDESLATPVLVVRPNTTSGIDAALAGGSTISGTVTDDDGGAPLANVCVYAEQVFGGAWGYARTMADGGYTVGGLPEGDYYIMFDDCGGRGYLWELYDNVTSYDLATPVSVGFEADVAGIDAGLSRGGTISGTVTGAGVGPLEGICVEAYGDTGFGYGWAETRADGTYDLIGLVPDDYRVVFYSCGFGGSWAEEWWDDQPDFFSADLIAVGTGNVTGIDAVLGAGATISGTITDATTDAPLDDVCVYAGEGGDTFEFIGYTNASGQYTITGINRGGDFNVIAVDCGGRGYLDRYYVDSPDLAGATAVPVAPEGSVSGIDIALPLGGWVEGTVLADDTGLPLEDVCVDLFKPNGWWAGWAYTDASGYFRTTGVEAGSYIVYYFDCSLDGNYTFEYFDDVKAFGSATPVAVTLAQGTTADASLARFVEGTGGIQGTVVRTSDGTPVSGAWVQTCTVDGRCRSATTGSTGTYSLTGLPDGDYTVRAWPPTSALRQGSTDTTVTGGGTTTGVTIELGAVQKPPAGTSVGGTSGGTGTTPVVYANQPFDMTVTEPPCDTGGAVTYTITSSTGEVVTGSLVEDPPGTWSGDIIVPFTGSSDVVISQEGCVDTIDFMIYIDPSGTVKTPEGDPIEGATIKLYRSDTPAGIFELVPDGSNVMAPSNRTNPDLSDADGRWGWDVVDGYYYVTAEKEGCVDPADPTETVVSSPTYQIPPAVTDVDLRLDCSGGPGLEFVPVTPCAYFDTRSGTGGFAGRLGVGETRTFQVAGTPSVAQGGAGCDPVPADAAAVEINLVAVGPTGSGNLQIAPAGVVPNGGVVNFVKGVDDSNALSVGVAGGEVDVKSNGGPVHVRGVVVGYYTTVDATGYEFLPLAPCAVFDTRSASGGLAGTMNGTTRTFQVTGTVPASQGGAACAAPPASATGVQLNLVAVSPTGSGNLRLSPSGTVAQGGVVNFKPGSDNSNAVSVETAAGGLVDVVANGGPVHVRGVVLGYYTDVDASGYEFVPADPCAVFDTRTATGAFTGPLPTNGSMSFDVLGTIAAAQGPAACAAPPDGTEVVHINLVALNATKGGNLKIAKDGVVANGGVVNFIPGVANANALDVEVSTLGKVAVSANGGPVHVRGVVLGYRVPGD